MSRKTQLLIGFILLLGGLVQAQIPLPISIEKNTNGHNAQLACTPGQENFAGTVSLGNINAQSNDINLDTMFLCLNDIVEITHNGDQNLTGDPDSSTDPGICYGFYNCEPTIAGPTDITSIGADPCFVPNPTPVPGFPTFLVFNEGSNLDGNITLFNDGLLQTAFGGGAPLLAFLSPLTYDALNDVGGTFIPNYENGGPCAHTNINAAFGVVYLNEITVSDIEIGPNVNTANCSAGFTLAGGLPEYDASENYSITISLSTNPTVIGSVYTGPASHNSEVKVSVPQSGIYNVEVEDGKGCPLSFTLDMSACTESVLITIQDQNVNENETVCFPVTVENFTDVRNFQFSVSYDPAVLNMVTTSPFITNVNSSINSLTLFSNLVTEGDIIVSWLDPALMGVNIPDGEVLFEICFDVVGSVGDATSIDFIETGVTLLEFNDSNGAFISAIINPGSAQIIPSGLNLDITVTNETCIDLDNGSISALALGGTAPFEFTCVNAAGTFNDNAIIVDPLTPYILNGLEPGTYTVTVTENAGAGPLTVFQEVEILTGVELAIIIDPVEGDCFGDPGDISATPALNGTSIPFPYPPNYTIEWSNGATDFELFGVPSGVFYSVTLTDTDNMCSETSTDLLSQPSQIVLSVDNIIDATCSGVPDGGLEISVTGGTVSFNDPNDPTDDLLYSIELQDMDGNSLATVNNSNQIIVSNLLEGDYTCIAVDQNNCTYSEIFSVGAITSLQLNVSDLQPINCFGDCNASITVDAQTIGGVTTNYAFNWLQTVNNVDAATSTTVTNLCPGSYTLQLTDVDSGCSTEATYDIVEPTELTATSTATQPVDCAPTSVGSIEVVANGGTPVYTYDWGILNLDPSTAIATNLIEGIYDVTVIDDNNCEVILSDTIITPNPPVINNLDNFTLECNGDTDGILFADAVGTDALITNYSWSTGTTGIAASTETNLTAGTYTVTVTDANNCEVIGTADVLEPLALVIDSIIIDPPNCPGDDNGSLTVQASGGSGVFAYNWSNNDQNAVNVDLSAGTYSITVSDVNTNCPDVTGTETIVDPPGINAIITDTEAVSCAGATGIDCDGSATVTAELTDGTLPLNNFEFNWLPLGQISAPGISSSVNTLCEGPNSVVVSYQTANLSAICSETFDFEIDAPDALSADFVVEDASCVGSSDGSITAQGVGGTNPYTYVWETNDTGPTLSPLASGTYEVTITDDNNCSISSIVSVGEPQFPLQAEVDLNASSETVSCYGESDAYVSITATGGNVSQGDIQYVWGPGISASITSSSAFGLSSGSFAVTVVDNEGCEFPLTFDVGSPDPINFNIPEIQDILCPGGTTTVTVDTAFGGNGLSELFYTFSIDGGAPQTLGTSIEVFPGQHIVTVTDISDDACSADTTFFIAGLTESVLSYPNPVEVELGESLAISPSIAAFNNPLDPDSIFWTPIDDLTFGSDPLSPTVSPIDDMTYLVEAYDINGCYIAAELIIEVDKNRNIYIPNIFTPNGDGFNSIFQPIAGVGVKSMNYFRVYDRWGSMLHERLNVEGNELSFENPAVAWDGKFKGREVSQGVYVYLAEIEFLDGRVLLYRGDVTLVK